ncbi:MAG TPA: amino acid ABC transporter substrate-binding protein [Dehalococcoidia bacterium]|nr:amino acid ABC transporter substrate-binding protein [Dehalococcoidia bacterium]
MRLRRVFTALTLTLIAIIGIALAACGDDDGGTATPTGEGSPTVAGTPGGGSHSQILQAVQGRGELICGVNDAVPGFGFLQPDGSFAGFDIDYCKAVAAAVLGDSEAVQYVPLTAEARLTALQTGQVDVLIRNTTWTVTRDAASGLSFATTTFYDGQGMMVREADGFGSVDDLADATVCTLQGTTTELNLADRLPNAEALGFENNDTLQQAFIEGRCDGWTSDKSQLAARRSTFPADAGGPESLVILEETFSKEPLGPVTIDNDDQWFQLVDWVVIGTMLAEELGITSANVDDMAASPPNVDVARLLGVPFEGGEVTDPGFGVDPTLMQEVIRSVGNYGEIYERNITPIGIDREGTLNDLWTDGGLMYGPPWR